MVINPIGMESQAHTIVEEHLPIKTSTSRVNILPLPLFILKLCL